MKKILLITCLAFSMNGKAQNKNVVSAINFLGAYDKEKNPDDLKDAKSYIDLAAAHEETKVKAKTWSFRGQIYMRISQSKDPKVNALSSNALDEATTSFSEAVKLDTKGNYPEAKVGLQNCLIFLSNAGINSFQSGNYTEALTAFERVISLNEEVNHKIDTNSVMNATLSAERAGNDDKALVLYQKLIAMNYGAKEEGTPAGLYSSMARIYKRKGETEKFLETLQKGRALFPNDKNLILNELNYYIETGKINEAISNIKIAIEKDPQNAVLHYNQGVLYDNLLNPEKGKTQPSEKEGAEYFANAEKAYNKAIEIKPDYFDAMYNLGALYFNKAVKQNDYANSITDNKKYDIESKKADELFRKSLPYMEKAEAMHPNEINSLRALYNSLSMLYRMTDQAAKAKEYTDKYKSLK
jgi:Flp pilus assembly protein TadD